MKSMSTFALFVAVLVSAVAVNGLSVRSAAAGVCEPIPTSSGGFVSLANSTSQFLTNVPIKEQGNPKAKADTVDIGVNFCTPFDAIHTPCKGHSAGFIAVSFNGEDPGCLASFDTFVEPWSWNGTNVVATMTDSKATSTAFVSVGCGKAGVEYKVISISEDSTGNLFNISFLADFACASSAYPTATPKRAVPFKTTTCRDNYCGEIPAYLTEAVESHGAPGMSAAAVRLTAKNNGTEAAKFETLYLGAAGRYTYDKDETEVTTETQYDMASCTKVVTTTTASAQLYQLGLLDLDGKVTDYLGKAFGRYGKENITIHNLMVHNAGFPPGPNPGYSSPIFNCPENAHYHPGQAFSCDARIFQSVLNQTLINPVGAKYVYSDLSFITLMFVVGQVVKDQQGVHGNTTAHQKVAALQLGEPCSDASNLICWFHAYVNEFVFKAYKMPSANFIPTNPGLTPPQWFDPWYHHSLIWGFVSDQNAYAMGGVSGHAGLFASVMDSIQLMQQWMGPAKHVSDEDPSVLAADTVAKFIKVQDKNQSSRALGWDTMYDPASGQWCGDLSKETFFHIGFTGTQLCGDPVNNVFTVLLANGRYPNYHVDGMIQVRPAYNRLVKMLLPKD